MPLDFAKVYRFIKTAILFYSYICLGLNSEIVGPSLPDLRSRLNLNHKQLSTALTMDAAGLFLGALVGGYLTDRLQHYRYALMAGILTLSTAAIASVPFTANLGQLMLTFSALGCVHGLHAANVGPAVVSLWGRRSTGPLNLIHAGYFVGFSLTPLILSAFHKDSLDILKNSTAVNSTTELFQAPTRDSRYLFLRHAFLFTSGLCFLCVLPFVLIAIAERCRKEDKDLAPSPKTRSLCPSITLSRPPKCSTSLILFILLFGLYFSSLGGDRLFCRYIYTYVAESSLQMGRQPAYIFNAIVGISYASSRVLISAISGCFQPELLLSCELVGTFLFSALLFLVTGGNYLQFWCIAVAFCLFKGPVHPTGIGVFNRYIEVSGRVQLVINGGAGFGSMTLLWLCGHLLDVSGYTAFLIILLANSLLTLVLGSALMFVGRRKTKQIPFQEEIVLDAAEAVEILKLNKEDRENIEKEKENEI